MPRHRSDPERAAEIAARLLSMAANRARAVETGKQGVCSLGPVPGWLEEVESYVCELHAAAKEPDDVTALRERLHAAILEGKKAEKALGDTRDALKRLANRIETR